VRAALSRAVPLVAALVAAVPIAQASAAELGERTLERGDRGDDVRELQQLLTRLGLDTETDGVFGDGTVDQVEAYERREDLSVDGVVSPGQVHGMERRAGEQSGQADGAGEPGASADEDPAGADGAPRPTGPADGTDQGGTDASGTFPVDGDHHWGDGFGDGRGHQGQDIMAACGTPLRAVKDVKVRKVATQAAAGRYVVLHDGDSGEDYVYMHLSTVDVSVGDALDAGDNVGEVGQTGDATACHLHFEEWTSPGWYNGGHAEDPRPLLTSLDGS
jgi:murein DD-endopeptidase MepM/ murein hydrolase activator NlpD